MSAEAMTPSAESARANVPRIRNRFNAYANAWYSAGSRSPLVTAKGVG